jgi:hypothetical protein
MLIVKACKLKQIPRISIIHALNFPFTLELTITHILLCLPYSRGELIMHFITLVQRRGAIQPHSASAK